MHVEVYHHDTKQKQSFSIEGTKAIIGRSPRCDIVVNRGELSRQHFSVEWDGTNLYITDLNSTNGILINQEKIPANVRTLYHGYFPIEVGDKISFTIIMDDSKPITPQPLSLEIQRPVLKASKTLTKKISTNHIKGKGSEQQSPSMETGLNKKQVIGVLFLLILALAIYFFGQSAHISQTLPSTPQDEFNISSFDFQQIHSQELCTIDSNLCLETGLTQNGEGITLQHNSLIAFVNLSLVDKSALNEELLKLPEILQVEYLLAKVGTHPSLMRFALSRRPKYLLIVGLYSLEQVNRYKYLTKIDYIKLPEFDFATHNKFFSLLYKTGDLVAYQNAYDSQIKDHIFLSEI